MILGFADGAFGLQVDVESIRRHSGATAKGMSPESIVRGGGWIPDPRLSSPDT
jgi:hypothetical protein